MNVRCKFRCDAVEFVKDAASVKFSAVTNGSEENKQFFKWTPGGQLTVFSVNLDAARAFVPGADYYLDITPA